MSQANQSMRGDLSDNQNSIGLEVLLEGLGIIFMKSSDHSAVESSRGASISKYLCSKTIFINVKILIL